jgi:HK97 family phage major capsid protein
MQTAASSSRPFLPEARHVPPASEMAIIARLLLTHNADFSAMSDVAEQRQMPARVRLALKAAVGAASLAGTPALAEISANFAAALKSVSAFDWLLDGGAVRLPLNTRLIASTTVPQGYAVGEGKAKPVSRLSLKQSDMALHKTSCVLVVSTELSRSAEPGAQGLIGTELRGGVSAATNTAFFDPVSGILAGITPIPSTGNPVGDLDAALGAVDLGEGSAPVWITTPAIAKRLSTWTGGGPSLMFPSMGPQGGELVNLPAIVSSALPTGHLVLLDAAGVGLADAGIELDKATSADVEMLDNPVGDGVTPVGATSMMSLWQMNCVGLRAERQISWLRLRDRAISTISGIAWTAP